MKVLFAGLGSIGQKNLEACRECRPDYEYAALRSSREKPSSVQEFYDPTEAIQFKPDLTWICTPTFAHRETLEKLQNIESGVFVEKPLAHSLEDLDVLEKWIQTKKVPFFYGCVLRHHPVIQKTREVIHSKSLGKALSYQLYCGSFLPEWRPGQDYRKTYSAQRSQGGGVAFDLIHEFDYAEFFFGPLEIFGGTLEKVSDLDIDSHDLCVALTSHENEIQGTISLNYFRAVPRRDFEIVFEDGLVFGDLIKGEMRITQDGKTHTEKFNVSTLDLYKVQAESVFSEIEESRASSWDVSQVAELNRKIIHFVNENENV